MISEPTINELIDTASKAVRGVADKNADFVRGSDYEALIGPSAIVWRRQALRDTDLFKAVNFNTAEGDDLTQLVWQRFGKARIFDTRGTGLAVLQRPASGVADTVWKGTRIYVPGPTPKFYRATKDCSVAATELVVQVPVEALEIGPGVAVDASYGVARLGDLLTDSTWVVASLKVQDGTLFEKAADFRDRVRRERLDARVGMTKQIITACNAAGAANVVLFRSDYAGEAYDHGLNFAYVGDLGNVGTDSLVKACTLALQKVRVAGDCLQVLPLARVELAVTADVYLYDSPALFDLARLERTHFASVSQYLNGTTGRFAYSLSGLRGAISRNTPEVQRVVLATPTVDDQIVSGVDKNFPAVLNRYVPGVITLRYHGP